MATTALGDPVTQHCVVVTPFRPKWAETLSPWPRGTQCKHSIKLGNTAPLIEVARLLKNVLKLIKTCRNEDLWFQEYCQSVKQVGIRLGQTICWACSGSKLFAKQGSHYRSPLSPNAKK